LPRSGCREQSRASALGNGICECALKAAPTRKAGAIRTEHIDPIPTQLATNKLSRGRGRRRGRERCASRVAAEERALGCWGVASTSRALNNRVPLFRLRPKFPKTRADRQVPFARTYPGLKPWAMISNPPRRVNMTGTILGRHLRGGGGYSWSAKKRSASIAAMQPWPAAVTA
jgi:hypothetical protein